MQIGCFDRLHPKLKTVFEFLLVITKYVFRLQGFFLATDKGNDGTLHAQSAVNPFEDSAVYGIQINFLVQHGSESRRMLICSDRSGLCPLLSISSAGNGTADGVDRLATWIVVDAVGQAQPPGRHAAIAQDVLG